MLFEPCIYRTQVFFGMLLFRKFRQGHNREVLSPRLAQPAHIYPYGQMPAAPGGEQERLEAPPFLPGFPSMGLQPGIVFTSKIDSLNIASNDFTAKHPGLFFENRIGEENLTGVVCDENSVIHDLENGLELSQPFRLPAVQQFLWLT
jgi:hypothetical protein